MSAVFHRLFEDGFIHRTAISASNMRSLEAMITAGVLRTERRGRAAGIAVIDRTAFSEWLGNQDQARRTEPVKTMATPSHSDHPGSGRRSFPLQSVREREVDLMMVEELTCEQPFAAWLAKECGLLTSRLDRAANSVWDLGRETDILAVFGDEALLIENKISAPLSTGQAADYRIRGISGMGRGDWTSFMTVVMAPDAWLQGEADHGFDRSISYEQIAEAIRRLDAPRASYRVGLLEHGIARARRRIPINDAEAYAFLKEYRKTLDEVAPQLRSSSASGWTPTSYAWHRFPVAYNSRYSLGRNVDLGHRIPQGTVHIGVGGCQPDHLLHHLGEHIPSEWTLETVDARTEITAAVPIPPKNSEDPDWRGDILAAAQVLRTMDEFVARHASMFSILSNQEPGRI